MSSTRFSTPKSVKAMTLVVAEAIDPDHAVLGLHFIGDVVEEVDAFTEALGDAVDGRDVIDLVDVHVQAASADAP